MKVYNDQAVIFSYVNRHYILRVEEYLKKLIEEKHLYQSLTIPSPNADDVFKDARTHFSDPSQEKHLKATCNLIQTTLTTLNLDCQV